MQNLNDMGLFASVAEAHSFTAAAERLEIPKSTVSRRIAMLEDSLGLRLLERTTRSLRLTEAGELYLGFCERIKAEAEQADVAVHSLVEIPRGEVRISAPWDIGQGLLTPLLGEFLRAYPEIQITLEQSNRRVDLLEEGIDVAIRVGKLEASSLIQRSLGCVTPGLYASREYLARTGEPDSPEALPEHDLLVMNDSGRGGQWRLRGPGRSVTLKVTARACANDFGSIRHLAASGLGIAMLPPYLAQGPGAPPLLPVLPSWSAHPAPVSALYLSHRGATPKLRALLDFLVEHLSPRLDTAVNR